MTFVRSPIIVMFDACSNLLIKTPEQRQSRRSGVFMVNVEHISHDTIFWSLQCYYEQNKCRLGTFFVPFCTAFRKAYEGLLHLCRNQSADLHCIQLTGFNILF